MVGLLMLPAAAAPPQGKCHMPYAEAGMTPVQASAHLLSRFSFGPLPGEVEAVAKEGPETWFLEELRGSGADPELESRLSGYPTLHMSCRDIANTYLPAGQILKRAEDEGIMNKADRKTVKEDPAMRERVMDYARSQGLHPEKELLQDLLALP